MTTQIIKKHLESRVLGNLHARFGVGAGVKLHGLSPPDDRRYLSILPSVKTRRTIISITRQIRRGVRNSVLGIPTPARRPHWVALADSEPFGEAAGATRADRYELLEVVRVLTAGCDDR